MQSELRLIFIKEQVPVFPEPGGLQSTGAISSNLLSNNIIQLEKFNSHFITTFLLAGLISATSFMPDTDVIFS